MSAAEDRLNELLRAARRQVQSGDRDLAIRTLQKALDIDPDNEEIRGEIMAIERENAAMKAFKRTRSARSFSPGEKTSAATGEGFVEECLRRSAEASSAGDDIRALQELERARRQDPENADILKRIKQVKRSIKANNLADLGMTRLRGGDPVGALEQARKIFEFWPASPALARLTGEMEGFDPSWTPPTAAAAPVQPPETVQAVMVEAPAAARPTSREEAAIASIRDRIARSAYAEAYEEAAAAQAAYPSNPVIRELVDKLRKVAAPEPARPAQEPRRERGEAAAAAPAEGRRRFPLVPVAIVGLLAIAAVILFVFVLRKPPAPAVPADLPYSATLVLQGPPEAVVNIDGNAVRRAPDGSILLTGSDFGTKNIEVRAEGYEVLLATLEVARGQVLSDTLVLQPLGTGTARVAFTLRMPEGEAQPDPQAVSYLVDGQPAAAIPIDLPTGLHVFQAVMDEFNSIPDTVLIDTPGEVGIELALLSPETSQISLTLAGDIPGSAVFYVDGAQVGTGRRLTHVAQRGDHTLLVTMDGRENWTRSIALGADGFSQTVVLEETVTTGRLLIGPEPWAEVSINGTGYGQTPMPPIELEAGTYTVRLTNPDYEDQEVSVQIVTGQDTSIRYTAPERQTQPEIIEEQPVIPPFPVSQPAPAVPGLAAQRGDVHGYITLEVRVGTDGSVTDVQVTNDPLGLGCGQAAADAVRSWRFNPATQGGVPVEVTTTVQVRFDVQ